MGEYAIIIALSGRRNICFDMMYAAVGRYFLACMPAAAVAVLLRAT